MNFELLGYELVMKNPAANNCRESRRLGLDISTARPAVRYQVPSRCRYNSRSETATRFKSRVLPDTEGPARPNFNLPAYTGLKAPVKEAVVDAVLVRNM